MTTTVLELIEKLQSYPANALLAIRNDDEDEFAIVDYLPGKNTLVLVISETEDEEEDDEE
ncbi:MULTISPECIES: hypothetical protein [unclassified Nostoc]|uniref:hypothetical protein n=1 Tax=unclassified Nostoc TaxID=2593658 RepID=UPI002AD3A1E6|nr:hypothetical protein [Nostoc sp. DedQUE03]MDZ7975768.1 hypothetical protein [Nostoc sp. DedQUE03]MDZ8048301.1 hypothetical protein [Nostoc sp. DedQUE02]